MKQYTVTGMSCAACQNAVERAVSKVPGVETVSVSLLTGTMGVTGSAPDDAVIRAVTEAGYGATLRGTSDSAKKEEAEDLLCDRETPVLRKRFFTSLLFLLILMYFSMGHTMFGWPVPGFFAENPVASGILQMILSTLIMFINRKFFISGTKSVLHGAPNMDTLVSLGSSASFLWSVYNLLLMSKVQAEEGREAAAALSGGFYFESAAMILVLITVGKILEAKSKGKTTNALKSLLRLSPKTATVIRDGNETVIPVEEVAVGNLFAVRPGESIPVDAEIVEGNAAVDESALTGESIPVDKVPGDTVSAATVNRSGFLRCRATRVGEDTTLSQIIRLVSDAAATKAPIARIADRVSAVFVPAVTGIALVTLVVWLLLGKPFDFALSRAISVLVISCPCALGLATPVAIMVGNGVGARNGVLFKTAVSLEETGKAQIIVLDKTGTITKGEPEVTEIVPFGGISAEELLTDACALEEKSSHPLAKAVVRAARERGISAPEVSGFTELSGSGLRASLSGEEICAGSLRYIGSLIALGPEVLKKAEALSDAGNTPLLFIKGKKLLGIIAVSDRLKEDARDAVAELEKMGLSVVMLTGDNLRTANAMGEKAGIGCVIAGVRPEEKAAVIRKLGELGKTVMTGDGINDAPALTTADIGIAIGAGTDVAIDAADVVLVNSRMSDIPAAIRLSRATLRNIHENLFWAFFYNILCIPLAAGVLIRLIGFTLNPMIGAAAMSLSSFFVVSNALRLNLFSVHSSAKDRKMKKTADPERVRALVEEINQTMEAPAEERILLVEGMMCPHCEAHVKKALESLDGVASAEADYTKGTVRVRLTKNPGLGKMKEAVEKEGYEVTGIR